jgi:predicted amidohydrolase
MRRLTHEPVDLLLMPHSAPSITLGPLTLVGQRAREMLRGMAAFYASALGIPTVMVNKAAGQDTRSPVPCLPLVRLRFHFVGQSTICNAGGKMCDQLDEDPGVVVADVTLDPQQKRLPAHLPSGYWSRPPPLFPHASAALFQLLEWTSKRAYTLSRPRRAAARQASAVAK